VLLKIVSHPVASSSINKQRFVAGRINQTSQCGETISDKGKSFEIGRSWEHELNNKNHLHLLAQRQYRNHVIETSRLDDRSKQVLLDLGDVPANFVGKE